MCVGVKFECAFGPDSSKRRMPKDTTAAMMLRVDGMCFLYETVLDPETGKPVLCEDSLADVLQIAPLNMIIDTDSETTDPVEAARLISLAINTPVDAQMRVCYTPLTQRLYPVRNEVESTMRFIDCMCRRAPNINVGANVLETVNRFLAEHLND